MLAVVVVLLLVCTSPTLSFTPHHSGREVRDGGRVGERSFGFTPYTQYTSSPRPPPSLLPPPPRSYANWMGDNLHFISNLTLTEVMLPGTHDSGAFQLYDKMGPGQSEELAKWIKLAAELKLPVYDLIKGWATSQSGNFTFQLEGGIRVFDLRCPWDGTEFRTQHMLLGNKVEDLLQEVGDFIATHPHEVVIVSISHMYNLTDDALPIITNIVQNTVGKYAAKTHTPLTSRTLSDLISSNERVIVTSDTYAMREAMPDIIFAEDDLYEGEYTDKDNVNEMVTANMDKLLSYGGDGRIFIFYWTLTDSTRTIPAGFLPDHPFTLHDMSWQANSLLGYYSQRLSNLQFGNIILSDFFEESDIVRVAIDFNRRQCRDDAKYKARSADGNDCRSW
eukprot:CAMPEP_0113895832 /NCGR_PEP_ID=MMETSP0780_2-20120614/17614_1 /TAXON_ID=652834 /ORGANISM="Palpitomonas bilix" /LENGTH=390 /DNA_ID=CAMNT_0000886771 /DNA_START=125 /DNA_END=1294 /DNA_ORIENTATION=- /assembly_acc=CAM_ASM_000599